MTNANWTRSDEEELHARELRDAAFHEASHAVLIGKFGGGAQPRVWRNPQQSECQRAWLGTCILIWPPGGVRLGRGFRKQLGIVRRLPKRWALYVAVAGFVGERMANGASEGWEIEQDFWEAFEDDEISESDLLMILETGLRPTQHTIDKTMDYLRTYWAEIEQQANWLKQCAPGEVPPVGR